MTDKNPIRRENIYISSEVYWMADKLRKVLAGEHPMTNDQYIDGLLREVMTTRHPSLVLAWEENQELRANASKLYRDQEAKLLGELRLTKPQPHNVPSEN